MTYYLEIDKDNNIMGHGYCEGVIVASETIVLGITPETFDTTYDPNTNTTYELESSYAARQINKRNVYLTQSDYTQIADATFPGTLVEWQTYRQQLRDLPTHSNWPYLEPEDWPTKPS